MAVPKLGAGTATLPVSRESLHSVQAAQPGHEVNRATPDNFTGCDGSQCILEDEERNGIYLAWVVDSGNADARGHQQSSWTDSGLEFGAA
ncbi:hypothetical protein O988_01305 [Pseudogymnoascus sp. VKM F-3808]|nr:hypothetical protein O988_01305 [Pseudogymnoascus sp. VKM F-3808]